MLQLTSTAAEFVRTVRDTQGHSDQVALRVDRMPGDRAALQLGFVDSPEQDDQVSETEGVPIYVSATVAPELDDKTLDVEPTAEGPALVLRES